MLGARVLVYAYTLLLAHRLTSLTGKPEAYRRSVLTFHAVLTSKVLGSVTWGEAWR